MLLMKLGRRLKCVKGANVLVVGSAPSFEGNLDFDRFDLIVSVNGSAGQLEKLGISPDLTFMSSQLLSDKCVEEDWREIRDIIGSAKATRGLITVRNGFHFEHQENYERFNYSRNEVTTVKLGAVRRTLFRVTKSRLSGVAPNGLPSMGIIATAYLAIHGSTSIHLSGFSLTSHSEADHFYGDHLHRERLRPRNHSAADLLVLSSLFIRGYDVSSTELELQTALTNWGIDGPTWYRQDILSRFFWSRFAPW